MNGTGNLAIGMILLGGAAILVVVALIAIDILWLEPRWRRRHQPRWLAGATSRCDIEICADTSYCLRCDAVWDTNDPDPPRCRFSG